MGNGSSIDNQQATKRKDENNRKNTVSKGAKVDTSPKQSKNDADNRTQTRNANKKEKLHVQINPRTPLVHEMRRVNIPDEFSDFRPIFNYQKNVVSNHKFIHMRGSHLDKLKEDHLLFTYKGDIKNKQPLSRDKKKNDNEKAPVTENDLHLDGEGDKNVDETDAETGQGSDPVDQDGGPYNNEEEEDVFTEEEILKRAAMPKQSTYSSHKDLLGYITEDVDRYSDSDKFTAWVILVWMANRNVSRPIKKGGTLDTPSGCVALMSQDSKNYSEVFAKLCSEAQIRCECIKGITRSSTYIPGEMNTDGMVGYWNAIQLNKNWYLVNPLWICRPELGPTGKASNQKGTMDKYFFLTKPKEYIYWCHPDILKWQLLAHTVKRDVFLTLPFVTSEFFRLDLAVISRRECVLESEKGFIRVKIESPKDIARSIYFWYEIKIIQASSGDNTDNEQKLTADEKNNLQRLHSFVIMSNFLNTWSFDISFPVEGIYEINVKAGEQKENLKTVVIFRLFCLERKSNLVPLPVDSAPVGFGPGAEAKKAGLLYPSHRHGVYDYSPGDRVDMSFRIGKDKLESVSFQCSLKGYATNKDSYKMEKKSFEVAGKIKTSTGEFLIQPVLPERGLYVLMININEGTNTKIRNVCNYLFTCDVSKTGKLERPEQQKAREMLSIAMKTETIDRIDLAVTNCLRVNIPLDDDQVAAAHTKAHILAARRDIDEALRKKKHNVVSLTLLDIQHAGLDDIFQDDVQKLISLKNDSELLRTASTSAESAIDF